VSSSFEFTKLSLVDIGMLVAAIGTIGLLMAVGGVLGIRHSRRELRKRWYVLSPHRISYAPGLYKSRHARARRLRGSQLSNGLTRLAVMVAGPRCASSMETWQADLLGDPDGESLNRRIQLQLAAGFVVAALKMRTLDVCRRLGRLLDWILVRDGRVLIVVLTPVAACIAWLFLRGGLLKVIEDAQNWCALGGAIWFTGTVLRKARGVQPLRKVPDSADK
jgi:hypothetical protein